MHAYHRTPSPINAPSNPFQTRCSSNLPPKIIFSQIGTGFGSLLLIRKPLSSRSSLHLHFASDIPPSGSPSNINTRRSSFAISYTELPPPPSPPPHMQPMPAHLSLHLYIPNCQSQSNLWNILEVTVYSGGGDNISRPL